MHRLLRSAVAPLALVCLVPATGARAGDCAPKVEPAAERVFAALVKAMRKADADGVVDLMAAGKEARLSLHLTGVKSGQYPREQALEVLKTSYFKGREILSLTENEDCTRGTETRLVRAYRMRVRSGGKEQDGTLTVVIQRGQEAWALDRLSDS